MNMDTFYKDFCSEEFDEKGGLCGFTPILPENFSFAYDVVDRIAQAEPHRQALIWCNDRGEEKVLSFGDIKTGSDRCAQMLMERGIIKGDFVLVALRRHYEFWYTMLALEKLGAVAVPTHHALNAEEFLYRFQAAGITACVVSGECATSDAVEEACKTYPSMRAKFIVRGTRDGWLDFTALLERCDGLWTRQNTKKTENMLLYFTSGTAGTPKMVIHDHTYAAAHMLTGRYFYDLHENDLHMAVAETGWLKALWGKLYGPWFFAAGILVYDFERFSPKALLDIMAKYKVTTFCAPAVIYRSLVEESVKSWDLSALRYTTTAGETLPPKIFLRWKQMIGLEIMESFGQTETAMLAATLVGMQPKPGSFGKPCPGCVLRLVDEDGLDVPAGAAGELCVDIKAPVPGLFAGYYHNEEATLSSICENLYHTGDMAWMDEDGYLWYIGRMDDIIKASGYRIGPVEIESILQGHAAVMECAVTGMPDPIRGTVVQATIVPVPGFTPSEAFVKELQELVKKHAAPYKCPKVIAFVDKLPRTLSGKIQRCQIRKRAATEQRIKE